MTKERGRYHFASTRNGYYVHKQTNKHKTSKVEWPDFERFASLYSNILNFWEATVFPHIFQKFHVQTKTEDIFIKSLKIDPLHF